MNKWAVVALLWFVCLFNYADRQAIFSVFPLLKTEMGLTDVQLGIVGASFMWVYAAAAPLAGIVGDRFARKSAHPRRPDLLVADHGRDGAVDASTGTWCCSARWRDWARRSTSPPRCR